jgi:hypothetical protein
VNERERIPTRGVGAFPVVHHECGDAAIGFEAGGSLKDWETAGMSYLGRSDDHVVRHPDMGVLVGVIRAADLPGNRWLSPGRAQQCLFLASRSKEFFGPAYEIQSAGRRTVAAPSAAITCLLGRVAPTGAEQVRRGRVPAMLGTPRHWYAAGPPARRCLPPGAITGSAMTGNAVLVRTSVPALWPAGQGQSRSA